MDNKYLDKVVDHMIHNTKIDYDNKKISLPYLGIYRSHITKNLTDTTVDFHHLSSHITLGIAPSFSKYCKNFFGLTNDEIKYVWEEYKDILLTNWDLI